MKTPLPSHLSERKSDKNIGTEVGTCIDSVPSRKEGCRRFFRVHLSPWTSVIPLGSRFRSPSLPVTLPSIIERRPETTGRLDTGRTDRSDGHGEVRHKVVDRGPVSPQRTQSPPPCSTTLPIFERRRRREWNRIHPSSKPERPLATSRTNEHETSNFANWYPTVHHR